MDRRRFLTTLSLGLAAGVVDPELLVWTPGTKTIFLPTPRKKTIFDLYLEGQFGGHYGGSDWYYDPKLPTQQVTELVKLAAMRCAEAIDLERRLRAEQVMDIRFARGEQWTPNIRVQREIVASLKNLFNPGLIDG